MAGDSDTLDDFAPYLMNRIMRRYNQTVQGEISPHGLTVPKMRALAALADRGDLTVNDLSVFAIAEQSTMSRTVDQMEKDGLIVRAVSPDDNRVRVVSLTHEGRAAYDAVWPTMRSVEGAMLDQLSPERRALFLETLHEILAGIRQHDF